MLGLGLGQGLMGRRPQAYLDELLVDDPLLLWRFAEASGDALDASGNGRDGTVPGSGVTRGQPGLSGDLGGASYAFDGTDGNYVSLASGNGLPTGAGARTIETLFRTSDAGPAGWGLFGYGFGSVNEAFALRRNNADNQSLYFYGWSNDHLFDLSSVIADLADGAVHHVALSYDGGTGLVLVFDGQVIEHTLGGALNTTDGTFGAGGTAVLSYETWKGLQDGVAVYGAALDPARIQAHYARLAA